MSKYVCMFEPNKKNIVLKFILFIKHCFKCAFGFLPEDTSSSIFNISLLFKLKQYTLEIFIQLRKLNKITVFEYK